MRKSKRIYFDTLIDMGVGGEAETRGNSKPIPIDFSRSPFRPPLSSPIVPPAALYRPENDAITLAKKTLLLSSVMPANFCDYAVIPADRLSISRNFPHAPIFLREEDGK